VRGCGWSDAAASMLTPSTRCGTLTPPQLAAGVREAERIVQGEVPVVYISRILEYPHRRRWGEVSRNHCYS